MKTIESNIKCNKDQAKIHLQTNSADEVERVLIVVDSTAIETNIEKTKQLEQKIQNLSKSKFSIFSSKSKSNDNDEISRAESELQITKQDVRTGFNKSLSLEKNKEEDLEKKIKHSNSDEYTQLKSQLCKVRDKQVELCKQSLEFEKNLKSKDQERILTISKEELSVHHKIQRYLNDEKELIELNKSLHADGTLKFAEYENEMLEIDKKLTDCNNRISTLEAVLPQPLVMKRDFPAESIQQSQKGNNKFGKSDEVVVENTYLYGKSEESIQLPEAQGSAVLPKLSQETLSQKQGAIPKTKAQLNHPPTTGGKTLEPGQPASVAALRKTIGEGIKFQLPASTGGKSLAPRTLFKPVKPEQNNEKADKKSDKQLAKGSNLGAN